MSDHQRVIRSFGQLESDEFLNASEPDAVARELRDLGNAAEWEVVVVQEWLIDDKDIEPIPTHYRIATGRVERETDKAILLSQGQAESWIPKSCSQSYVLAPDADLEIPQTALESFARGECDD